MGDPGDRTPSNRKGGSVLKVLLTGASGGIGQEACAHLVEQGFDVRATDIRFRNDLPVPVRVANLLDREVCYELVDGVEAIVHLGNHPRSGVRDNQTLLAENCTMNINLFQAAAEVGVKKIVFASSIQAALQLRGYRANEEIKHSTIPYLPIDANIPAKPGNTYGLSKLSTERMMQYFADQHGMSAIAIRFPMMVPELWIEHIRRDRMTLDKIRHANLDECFSYLTMKDGARLLAACLRAPLEGFRLYFIAARGTSVEATVPELIKRFYADVELRKPIEEIDSFFDLSRVEAETGWSPQDVL
jgi:nucleoside-diphosphate-sugar epimerase